MRALAKLCLVLTAASLHGGSALANVAPSLTPVAIEPAAIVADPNLANFRTYDLQVTVSAGDHWYVTDMQTTTVGGVVGPVDRGTFYTPAGVFDSDFPQYGVYSTPALNARNCKFDTWVDLIPDTPDAEGNYWSGVNVFSPGAAAFPQNHGSQHSIMPRSADNPNNESGIANAQNQIDIEWADLSARNRTYPTPGTYTIARLTVSNDFVGGLAGRVAGDVGFPNSYVPFSFIIPEPSSAVTALLAMTGPISARRRRHPRKRAPRAAAA
jgi:hypothetical protein